MIIRVRTRSIMLQYHVVIAWLCGFAFASTCVAARSQEDPNQDQVSSAQQLRTDNASSQARAIMDGATRERTSIEHVPIASDLYISVFHLRDTVKGIVSSPLAEELVQSQLWQKLQVAFFKEWKDRKSDIGRYRTLWENQSVKELLRFLEDVASEDLFFYSDDSLSKTLLQLAEIQKKLHVLTSEDTRAEVKADLAAQWIDQLLPSFQFPTLMVGGRFSDQDLALAKVDELEGLIRFGIGSIPDAAPLLKPLRRIEDARGSRLQWQVYGKSLPWDSIPEGDILDRESLQDLRNAVAEKSLTLTLGMIDGYFVASISGNPDAVNSLGDGDYLLEHHQLAPLRELSQQRTRGDSTAPLPIVSPAPVSLPAPVSIPSSITNVTWISDDLANALFELQLRGFFERMARTLASVILPNVSKDGDLREFVTQLVDEGVRVDALMDMHVPKFRGHLGWSANTDNGWESIGISRTEASLFDGESPLDCVSMSEETPLLLLDVRLANHPEYFQTARNIAKRMRVLGRAFLDVDDKEIGDATVKSPIRTILASWPLLERWADNWQQKILSNFAGEHAFIISPNGPAARQWHPALPPSDEPLVLPEFRLSHVVSDEKVWWEGVSENWKITMDLVGGGNGDLFIQGLKNVLASFPASGFEDAEKFTPRIDLRAGGPDGTGLAVWTHTKRNWGTSKDRTTRKTKLGIIDPKDKQSVAAFIDLGGIIRHWRPWVRYGLRQFANSETQRLPIPTSNRGTELDIYVDDALAFVDILGKLGTLSSSRETRVANPDRLKADGSNDVKASEFINRWRAVYQAQWSN